MFGLTPFERNDIWNPLRDFEKDFIKGFGAVSHCRTDIKDEGDICLSAKCAALTRTISK